MDKKERLELLIKNLYQLRDMQLNWVEKIILQFKEGAKFNKYPTSNIIDDAFLQNFGDTLRIHHCFSNEPFTKEKFEYAMNNCLKISGIKSELAPRGNPGFDIIINDAKYSLKTQANKSIKLDEIHISKFMELGKGDWSNKINDLIGLREQFFQHMSSYNRILILRCIKKPPPNWHYELVEIPKSLLQEAKNGKLVMKSESKQMPKPGYCYVTDKNNDTKYELYFDGGGERKLQIKKIKKQYCSVHANWIFNIIKDREL